MTSLLVFVIAAMLAPPSIENAHIEPGASSSPLKVMDAVGRGKTAEWVGWSVEAIPQAKDTCCFTNKFKRRGCSLSDRDNSWGTTNDPGKHGATDIYVLVEMKDARPNTVRVLSSSCPVDGAGRRIVWLDAVDAGTSLAALSKLLEANDENVYDAALAALAFHADSRADAVIEKRIFDRSVPEDARKQAIFWAGNARGAAGYRLLERVLASEPNGELREHAVFALTQSSAPGAVDRIKRVATDDRDGEVRAQSLFWLAQTNAPGAGEWIVNRLDTERDEHVREQAVFALSQLEDGTDWLLKVLRSRRDPETVRRALFWLGQSDDPRALEEIEKILDRS